jgi:hypothetical protein
MTRATFTIAFGLLCATATAEQPLVTFVSPCDVRDNHGEGRWTIKNDASVPPTDALAIQAVTPSDVFSWPGIDAQITRQSERTGRENDWYSLTGRVVVVRVTADGDVHLELRDAAGDKPGIVICEVPAEPQWCDIRKTIFEWTRTRFPVHVHSARKFIID